MKALPRASVPGKPADLTATSGLRAIEGNAADQQEQRPRKVTAPRREQRYACVDEKHRGKHASHRCG